MATATWIKNMLKERGVAYEELHHRVAFTAQEVAQSEHTSGDTPAKVVVIIADGRPVELILSASRRVVLDRVRKLLGASAVRLASEAEMEQIFTDCETGAIPPLRHWKDVAVLMDSSMSSVRDLVFQAGTHEDAIRLKFQDWFALVAPRVESFAAPEHARSETGFEDREDVGSKGPGRGSPGRGAESKRESGQPGGRTGPNRRGGALRRLSRIRPLSRGRAFGAHPGRVCPRPARRGRTRSRRRIGTDLSRKRDAPGWREPAERPSAAHQEYDQGALILILRPG
jgi:Ala-tRNA(Pro) deacylase